MNKIVEALNNGKTVYFKSPEPRYYRLIKSKLYYSDNLSTWKESAFNLPMFIVNESAFEVLKCTE